MLKSKKNNLEPKEKRAIFNRGYSEVRDKIEKSSRYTMSCFNCEFYSKTEQDEEEVCQNPDVLQYDMVVTSNNIHCNRWELTHRNTTAKSLFRKGRRNGK